jgi:nucleoid-associated protein YejK
MNHLDVEFYCTGQAEPLNREDEAIEFSSKLAKALQNKMEKHNLSNDKNITLDTLKMAFTNALTHSLSSSWALAKVNMFLNSSSAGYIDDSDHFEPSMEEIKEAEREIKKYGLENYEFNSADDLYLQTDKELRADAQKWIDNLN